LKTKTEIKDVKFYARPYGTHLHASKKCQMLIGTIFKQLEYDEITLEEAQKRELSLCGCVDETFGVKRFLTINGLIKYIEKESTK
jgi:hypothetical protein